MWVCVWEERKDTHWIHTHFIISHTLTPAAEVRGIMVQIRLLQMEPLTPNSLNLTERETSHSSHLTQRVPQELKETQTGGSSRMPFLIFLIFAITDTVIMREKRTVVLGPCDSSVVMLQLMILFSCTHRGFTNMTKHLCYVSREQKYSCAYYESYFLDQKYAPEL